MKEIIYIQAGNISNHIGAHFWNTQESYFTYNDQIIQEDEGEKGDESLVDHDISFRQGVSWGRKAEPTFCPRVLIFDQKSNFGALGKYNDLYADPLHDDSEHASTTWSGPISELKQPLISKSEYLQRLDEGDDSIDSDLELDEHVPSPEANTTEPTQPSQTLSAKRQSTPQYWSDYNHMFFIPRSMHTLPDTGIESESFNAFGRGMHMFRRYEQENSLMEDDFRRFVEECDFLQGFQLTFDAHAHSPFAGFSSALLECLRDGFAKSAVLSFPVGVGVAESSVHHMMHDISTMLALEEHTTGVVTLANPAETWIDWRDIVRNVEFDAKMAYHASAILSAHLESATLPVRFKPSVPHTTLHSLLAQLNWSQSDKFSSLAGLTGRENDTTGDQVADRLDLVPLFDFSEGKGALCNNVTSNRKIAQQLVSRGPDTKCTINYTSTGSYFTRYTMPAYPVLSSSPYFFRNLSRQSNPPDPSPTTGRKERTSAPLRSLPLPLLTSLHTAPSRTAVRFANYATKLEAIVKSRNWAILSSGSTDGVGIEDAGGIGESEERVAGGGLANDEVKETVERLWKIAEGCGWEHGCGKDEGEAEDEIDEEWY